jgi:hypothetical protein
MRLNTSGKFSTSHYYLGRGILRLAPVNAADDLLSGGFLDQGNVTALEITVNSQESPHYSSREGLRSKDTTFITQQDVEGSFTTESLTLDAIAQFLAGVTSSQAAFTVSTGSYPIAIGGASPGFSAPPLGRWLRLFDKNFTDPTAKRLYGIKLGTSVLSLTYSEAGAGATPLDAADFTFDLPNGLVFIENNAANVARFAAWNAANDVLNFVVATAALQTSGWDQTSLLTDPTARFALHFVGINANDDTQRAEVWLPKIRLVPNGNLNLISETDPAAPSYTLSVETSTAHPATPRGWIRGFPKVAA